MPNGKLVAATLISMTIVAVFFAPLVSTVNSSTGTVGVAANVDANVGDYQDIEGYDITNNFTATDSDGNTLSEGSDYELNETQGTIKFLSGSADVTDGEAVELVYEYQATDATTATIAGLIPLFAALLLIGVAAFRIQRMM